jgi:hypothetical protein
LTNGQAFYVASGGTGVQSPIKIQTSGGSALLVIDSNGRIGINYLPNVTIGSALPAGTNNIGKIAILTSGGTAGLVIDSTGKIGINNFPSLQAIKLLTSGGTAGLIIDASGKIGINNFPTSIQIKTSGGTACLVVDSTGKIGVNSLPALPSGSNTIGAVTQATGTVLNIGSQAYTSSSYTTGQSCGAYKELLLVANITVVSGTSPVIVFYIDVQGPDANWYPVYNSAQITATGQLIATVGVGAANNTSFGGTVRLRWTITGTSTSFTFSAFILGKT